MAERLSLTWAQVARWGSLAAAVGVLSIFLVAQGQSIQVSYGQSPSRSGETVDQPSAGTPAEVTVPSGEEMAALVRAKDVVRLPGAIAFWDEGLVRAAAGDLPMRILVAPPGLDKDEQKRVRDVDEATIRVIGTEVSGGMYQAATTTLTGWRAEFAAGDVTSSLLTLISGLKGTAEPSDIDTVTRREPTAAELQRVVADLRGTGIHVAEGATLSGVPDGSGTAFPGVKALYVALPRQAFGDPVVRYGPALAAVFPNTPIVVMYGSWIEYDGPDAAEFADLAGATYYGKYGELLSKSAYRQRNVLAVYVNGVADVRYSGLFDRPLPYRPVDPLRVALPALPWLFGACVAVFLVLSVRSARRPAGKPGVAAVGTPARLAGLTGLAVEMSALTHEASEPGLARGITKLLAARDALDAELPDDHVRSLLDDARDELDEAAKLLPFTGYRPDDYVSRRA